MPDLGTGEILIIAVVILILFGSAKLPQAARSLGRSMRIFKSETKGLMTDEDDKSKASAEADDARAGGAAARAGGAPGAAGGAAPADRAGRGRHHDQRRAAVPDGARQELLTAGACNRCRR